MAAKREDDVERLIRLVVNPTREKWGPGWDLLSDYQRWTEVRSALLSNLEAQASRDGADWSSFGAYCGRMLAALAGWEACRVAIGDRAALVELVRSYDPELFDRTPEELVDAFLAERRSARYLAVEAPSDDEGDLVSRQDEGADDLA